MQQYLCVEREELRRLLDEEGIDPASYTFDGGHPPEMYVLSITVGGWTVYYSERGLETARQDFDTEDAACRHLLDLLRRDETVHYQRVIGPLPAAEADAAFSTWADRHGLTLTERDFRVDDPLLQQGPVRRYWGSGHHPSGARSRVSPWGPRPG